MYPLTVQGDLQFNPSPVNVHLQIYPDPELEQQILALPIRCIHSEEGCRWTGQMKQLQVRSPAPPLHPRRGGRNRCSL